VSADAGEDVRKIVTLGLVPRVHPVVFLNRHSKMPSGDQAFLVAGLAVAAHDGPHFIHTAGDMLAERAAQGRAAVVEAEHAADGVIDEFGGDARDLCFGFERETRPVARIGATGAAALTVKDCGALSRVLGRVLGRLTDQAALMLRTATLPERLSCSVSKETF
jgi:hypothetical protein